MPPKPNPQAPRTAAQRTSNRSAKSEASKNNKNSFFTKIKTIN